MQVSLLSADRQPTEMHRYLDGVPALVIDYDRDFDLEDQDARESYVSQVKDYYNWVEDYRCAPDPLLPESQGCSPLGQTLANANSRRSLDRPGTAFQSPIPQ